MKFTQDIILQYIIANGYEKPKIEISNYYLKWNEKCYGIYPKEIVELKEFVKNVIPYFDAIYKLINSLERPRSKPRFFRNKELSPDIHFSHQNKAHHLVSYDLYMMSDGATFIDRTEKIEIISNDDNTILTGVNVSKDNYDQHEIYLKSTLGQLLFNRLLGRG